MQLNQTLADYVSAKQTPLWREINNYFQIVLLGENNQLCDEVQALNGTQM